MRRVGGTGLGLSIALGDARAHGGTLTASGAARARARPSPCGCPWPPRGWWSDDAARPGDRAGSGRSPRAGLPWDWRHVPASRPRGPSSRDRWSTPGSPSQFIRVIAAPPSVGASPTEIVRGFLEANASLESDHAIARRYLTPEAAGNLGSRCCDHGLPAVVPEAVGGQGRDHHVRAWRSTTGWTTRAPSTRSIRPPTEKIAFTLEQVVGRRLRGSPSGASPTRPPGS